MIFLLQSSTILCIIKTFIYICYRRTNSDVYTNLGTNER